MEVIVPFKQSVGTPSSRTSRRTIVVLLLILGLSSFANADSLIYRQHAATELPWSAESAAPDAEQAEDAQGFSHDFSALTAGYYNSGFAYGQNDGYLWAGRGFTTDIAAAYAFRSRWLKGSLAVNRSYTENRGFEIHEGPIDRLGTYGPSADLPGRLGEDPVHNYSWEGSNLFARVFGARAGFSLESYWTGPGTHYSLLKSTNAPQFPHLYFGTDGPLATRFGTFELMASVGWTEESKYFDDDPKNDENRVWQTGFSYQFPWYENFRIGFARVHHALPEAGIDETWLQLFFKSRLTKEHFSTGDDLANQMFSAMVEWDVPSLGVRFYGELGRDDGGWDLRQVFLAADHTRAFVLGFQKRWDRADWSALLTLEMVDTGYGQSGLLFTNPDWYSHHLVAQEYTHQGEYIGMQHGATNAQYMSLAFSSGPLTLAGFVERVGYQHGYFLRYIIENRGRADGSFSKIGVRLPIGIVSTYQWQRVALQLGTTFVRHFNYNWVPKNDKDNWNLWLGLKYDVPLPDPFEDGDDG